MRFAVHGITWLVLVGSLVAYSPGPSPREITCSTPPCCCVPAHALSGPPGGCIISCGTGIQCSGSAWGVAAGECKPHSGEVQCSASGQVEITGLTLYNCIRTTTGCPQGQAKCVWEGASEGSTYVDECSGNTCP